MSAADVSPRKQPQQARSRQMRERILEASIRVLRVEGALGFTTTRVADEAGISVGSLYQYFPNKRALVFAVHDQNVSDGWAFVEELLERSDWTARRKLEEITQWFFASEAAEATKLGTAVNDVDFFLREAGVNADLVETITARFERFLHDEPTTKPRNQAERRLAVELLLTTIESVGKAAAARGLPPGLTTEWATATATMLSDMLGFHTTTDAPPSPYGSGPTRPTPPIPIVIEHDRPRAREETPGSGQEAANKAERQRRQRTNEAHA